MSDTINTSALQDVLDKASKDAVKSLNRRRGLRVLKVITGVAVVAGTAAATYYCHDKIQEILNRE